MLGDGIYACTLPPVCFVPMLTPLCCLQLRMRLYAVVFFVVCIVLLNYLKINTCSSFVLSWFGFLPLQV